jgi:molybdopterin-guanine dinucleotide biosynthesis protein A
MTRPVGIVLAGGASSRFGSDKVTAPFEGRPLVHHALERLAEATDRIILVLAPDADVPPLPSVLVGRIDVARDAATHRGPLAGLAAALDVAPEPAGTAIVVGADMPHLDAAVLELLGSTLNRHPGTGAAILEADPTATLPMAIDIELARLAANALLADDRRSLRALVDALHALVVPAATWRAIDPDARTLDDIDLATDVR